MSTARKQKFINIFFLVLPFLIAALVLLSLNVRPVEIIPGSSIKFYAYSDTAEQGNSVIDYFRQDSSLLFGYTLRSGYAYPYAGFTAVPEKSRFYDFHKFNRFLITCKTSSSNSFRIYFHTYEDSITKSGVAISERYNGVQIPTERNLKTCVFSFSQLVTPEWWYQRNNVFPLPDKSDYSRVTAIDFNNGVSTEKDIPDTLTITELKIYRDIRLDILKVTIAILSYFLVFFIIWYWNNRKEKLNQNSIIKIIPYQKIEMSNSSDEESEKVVSYLGNNFNDPDISINKIAKSTGISSYKVPVVIQNVFKCSFKEYLNKIRIEEAMRLLSETDRQVTEISFSVGYNSLSHFCRLFKDITGKTPREFRETSKKTVSKE